MDATRVKERFLLVAGTARGLLSDFRAVEQNFRDLDRAVRERIATWEGAKGELLEEIFGDRDTIANSDQGKSFRRFWDFLMSPARQEELTALLAQGVRARTPMRELGPDPAPAARPLRLARGRRSGAAHRGPAVGAAAPLPGRQGVAGQPPDHAADTDVEQTAPWRFATPRAGGST